MKKEGFQLTKYGINPKTEPWKPSWRKRWTGARKSVDTARNQEFWKEPDRIAG